MLADIGPGVRVLESGVGSGALSMTMLRYGADIVGYELREDFANRAKNNVRAFLGEDVMDRYTGRAARLLRRHRRARARPGGARSPGAVAGPCPTRWKALRPGGIFIAYLPSIIQVSQLREAISSKQWNGTRTLEVLHRGWYVRGQRRARPDHRMVAHTAFLTVSPIPRPGQPSRCAPTGNVERIR